MDILINIKEKSSKQFFFINVMLFFVCYFWTYKRLSQLLRYNTLLALQLKNKKNYLKHLNYSWPIKNNEHAYIFLFNVFLI